MKELATYTIFNAALREYKETPEHKCFCTFQSEEHAIEQQCFQLIFLNEEYLAPTAKTDYTTAQDSFVVLLPINGALLYNTTFEGLKEVQPEQAAFINLCSNSSYTLSNPLTNQWNHYLHIVFKSLSNTKEYTESHPIEFKELNQLVPCVIPKKAQHLLNIHLGIYTGRTDNMLQLSNDAIAGHIYIIRGAFEVNGRLLETGDGLNFTNEEKIEFEALSENAILLLIEIKNSYNSKSSK